MTALGQLLDPSLSSRGADEALRQRYFRNPHTSTATTPGPIIENGERFGRRRLTEALRKARTISVKPLLTLTLEDVSTDLNSLTHVRQDLLRRFEVGLDGIKAIVCDQAYFSPLDEPRELSPPH